MSVPDSFFNLGGLYRFWGVQPLAAPSEKVASIELPKYLSWVPVVSGDASPEEKKAYSALLGSANSTPGSSVFLTMLRLRCMGESFVKIWEFVERSGRDANHVEAGAMHMKPNLPRTPDPSFVQNSTGVSNFPIVNEELSGEELNDRRLIAELAAQNPKLASDIDFCLATRRLGFGYPYAKIAKLIENLVAMKAANMAQAMDREPVVNCDVDSAKSVPCENVVGAKPTKRFWTFLVRFWQMIFTLHLRVSRLAGLLKN
jgi:hypothetical protein